MRGDVDFLIAIPARIGSKRLPRKPLRKLAGKPLILWTLEACLRITENVVVATDDEEVAAVVKEAGGMAVITSSDLPSGTDRVYAAVKNLGFDIVINVQGDEPFVRKEHVLPVVESVRSGNEYATVAVPFSNFEKVEDPSNVKVVTDNMNYALYFSRSVIPFFREGAESPSLYLKHIGIYGYTLDSLSRFVSWEEGRLERTERLEQLRILENGYRIHVSVVESEPFGIDTERDLEVAEEMIRRGEV